MFKSKVLALLATAILCSLAVDGSSLFPDAVAVRPLQRSSFCHKCRSAVSYVSRFNETSTKSSYRDLVTSFCQVYYPISTDFQQGPCGVIVNAAFYVLENTDPVAHCDQIGACSYHPGALTQPPKSKSVKSVSCDVCVSAVSSIKKQLTDPETLHLVKTRLEAFCEYLKLVNQSEECKQEVENAIEYLRDFAFKINPESYCQSIRFCSIAPSRVTVSVSLDEMNMPLLNMAGFGPQLSFQAGDQVTLGNSYATNEIEAVNPKHHSKGPACSLCKLVFTELTHFLAQNRTKENIEHGIGKICSVIYRNDEAQRGQCQELIEKYSDEIIDILMQETDPKMVCVLLGECVYVAPPKSTVSLVSDDESSRQIETLEDLFINLDSSLVKGSLEVCVECKLFIRFLQDQMKNPKSVAELEDALKKQLCAKLPDDSRDSCTQIIDKYGEEFFKAVAQNLDPSETCANLGACKAKTFLETIAQQRPKSAPICDQCVQVVEKIDEYVSKNDINSNVEQIIENVCKPLEESLANKCTYIVEAFGSELISAISKMKSPKDLCASIWLC